MAEENVLSGIPHRSPFLFVDKIIASDEDKIIVEKTIDGKEDFFKGHYPNSPIMPGVLLCECIFQAGALWISKEKLQGASIGNKVPVVARVNNVKFKAPVFPNTLLNIEASFKEELSGTYYMKGNIKANGKRIVTLDFACALIEPPQN